MTIEDISNKTIRPGLTFHIECSYAELEILAHAMTRGCFDPALAGDQIKVMADQLEKVRVSRA